MTQDEEVIHPLVIYPGLSDGSGGFVGELGLRYFVVLVIQTIHE